jgi:transcriptional regulator with XRE-family HTH domain
VRQLRSAQALTQGELAERAGVSRTWLNQLESGARRNVELASVIGVLDALGARLTVTVDEVQP